MKKLILFFGILGFMQANFAVAQSTFVHTTGTDTATNNCINAVSNNLDLHNGIRNTSSITTKYEWRITGSSVNNGWVGVSVCDNVTCTPGFNTSTYTSDVVAPNAVCDMKVTFDCTNAANNSFAWVTITEKDTASNFTRTNTFIASKGTVGLASVVSTSESVVLFPNPVQGDVVNVLYNPSLGVKTISLYNVIGKKISVYRTSDNKSAKLTEINKLPAGIYFLRMANEQGQIVATKKFTNQ